jgi:hypothetical protein
MPALSRIFVVAPLSCDGSNLDACTKRTNDGFPNSIIVCRESHEGVMVAVIIAGQRGKARYWGNYRVKKVAKLKSPVLCHSKQAGEVEFMPTIVQLEWETPPSPDNNEFWFPYWVKIGGKEKYGQFAPMIGKKALLQLLDEAIGQDFFDRQFLVGLARSIEGKLEKPYTQD